MAVLIEKMDSQSGTMGFQNPRREVNYLVLGTDDDNVMHALVQATIPLAKQVTFKGVNQVLTFQNYDHRYADAFVYEVTASYAKPEPKGQDEGDGPKAEYSFDTTGKTERITQSINTISRTAPPGKTATDHGGAINVANGKAEGVDVPVPAFAWQETHYFTDAQITDAYKRTLSQLTGKVNAGTWRGNSQGEVRFNGARGSKRGGDEWQISFLFEYSENATDIAVGGGSAWASTTVPAKKGWELLWFEHAEASDETAKALATTLLGAYVEQVHHYADFALLGLG